MNQFDQICEQIKTLSPEELVRLIRHAAELLEQVQVAKPTVDYVAFIGSGKGVFATSDEVDQFIRAERDGWEK